MMLGNENLSSMLALGEMNIQSRENESPGLEDLRQKAMDSFLKQGFDLRGREDWKYSDLKSFNDGRFVPMPVAGARVTASDFSGTEKLQLVFVNGYFAPDFSKIEDLPAGVTLSELSGSHPAGLGEFAPLDDAPFVALNTVLWTNGMHLELADGVTLDSIIHLHFITEKNAAGKLVSPRNFIRLGKGSTAVVVEHFSNQADCDYLQSPVTEIFCEAESHLSHLKIIDEGSSALHLGSTYVRQAENSTYRSREFAMSGTMVRRELHLDLLGEGAFCDLKALSMASGNETRDMRTRVQHLVSGCETHELYKGLYDDDSKGIFDGKILVARNAQQTIAHQTNRNLLLSDDAVSNSIPRLEIYADDVKCSHGSTTGQLDDDQIFFLRSRGFDAATSRIMLAKAFAREILDGVEDQGLKDSLDATITKRLAHSLKGNQ